MRFIKCSFFILSLSLLAFSCSKSDPGAGKGGSANLTINLKHHGIARNLIKCKLYVKYNTLDKPANGIYDDSVTASSPDTMQTAVFPGLRNGNYYLYGYGCDTSIFQQVVGGVPYTVASQSNQSYDLPVSETGIPCN